MKTKEMNRERLVNLMSKLRFKFRILLRLARLQEPGASNRGISFLPLITRLNSFLRSIPRITFPFWNVLMKSFPRNTHRLEHNSRVWPPLNCARGVPVFTTLKQPGTELTQSSSVTRGTNAGRICVEPLFALSFLQVMKDNKVRICY